MRGREGGREGEEPWQWSDRWKGCGAVRWWQFTGWVVGGADVEERWGQHVGWEEKWESMYVKSGKQKAKSCTCMDDEFCI